MSTARVVALLSAAAGAVLLFVPWTWGGYRCGSAVVPGQGLPADLGADRDGGVAQLLLGPVLCAEVLSWVRLAGVLLVVAGLVAVVLLGWRARHRSDSHANRQDDGGWVAPMTREAGAADVSSSTDVIGPGGRRDGS